MISLIALFVALSGTAFAANLAKNSVKSKHVKDNALKAKDLKDGKAVGSAEVIDNSLTGADIDEASLTISGGGAPSGPAGGGLTGTYPNPLIADNAVNTAQIADNAVNSAKVAADSLVADDLANDSVGTGEIADNAVNSAKVAADSLTAGDLAANSVDSSELAANSVDASELTEDSVGNSELGLRAANAENFEGFASLDTDFGTIANQRCTNRDVDFTNLAGNTILDDLIVASPNVAFSGEFAVSAWPLDADTARVTVCLNGAANADPDGAGSTLRVIAIDFPG